MAEHNGMNRRTLIAAAAALPLAAKAAAAAPYRVVANGLLYPECPVEMPDGSILIVEIARKTLTRIARDGSTRIIAELGGGPNGLAIGSDGAAYVANNGGLTFQRVDGALRVLGVPEDYRGGSIQRVDLATGAVTTLYTHAASYRLNAPNDLVFDGSGGFWFTDTGKDRARERDNGGVYWAKIDGSEIREVVFPLQKPNGIALSPDRKTLYVVLNEQRMIIAYEIAGPGRLAMDGARPRRRLVAGLDRQPIDNISVEAGGNIIAACCVPGGLTVFAPEDGRIVERYPLDDILVTSLGFGGRDLRTAYVTLASTGRLIAIPWPRAGLPLLG
ncbi:gluconolactonase [Sphingomonas sp. YR710]|uniref:SMP-30/gluconolactonase/LRE family protein n=1 Tax=Sphingomonas sp. YR710 TaxID=1882773 RepID=UPI00088EE012|nr:SMP-30/gluconolactonase/LRE family protein [Sphingomonas sp. YR710]SDC82981.1 gluconolactonase [Sphingomonas sp. YR710]